MNPNQDGNIRTFSFAVNLTGVKPGLPGAGLEDGCYKAFVVDAYTKPDKPYRLVLSLEVADGPFKGARRTTGLNMPTADDPDKARKWIRSFLESLGYTPEQIDAQQQIAIAPGLVLSAQNGGRVAHIEYTNAQTEGGYDNVAFFPPAEWAKRVQELALKAQAGGNAANGAGAGSALGGMAGAANGMNGAAVGGLGGGAVNGAAVGGLGAGGLGAGGLGGGGAAAGGLGAASAQTLANLGL